MRILAWTLSYWHDAKHARRFENQWCSHEAWLKRVVHFFHPIDTFIACGSWSNPAFNPIKSSIVVNAGVPFDRPYDFLVWHYGACAFSAAMAYALNRNDWDYLLCLDTDALIGAVDFPPLFEDFSKRFETILAPGWHGGVGGPFMLWKRAGVVRLAHHRICPDLGNRSMIWEAECAQIYKGGHWWNPWPEFVTLTDGSKDPVAEHWPFVSRPLSHFVEPYLRTQTSRAVPLPAP